MKPSQQEKSWKVDNAIRQVNYQHALAYLENHHRGMVTFSKVCLACIGTLLIISTALTIKIIMGL